MKILIISHEYPPIGGGGANACMYLSREYADRGHEVCIITAWYEGLLEEEKYSNNEGLVTIFRLKTRRQKKESCSFVEMFDFLLKAIHFSKYLVRNEIKKGKQFDVCQVFFGIPSGPVGFILKKKYGIPYVIRFGGGDIPGFQERFKSVYKILSPLVKLLWKNADALMANSKGLKNLALAFCDKYPVKVIFNGVDTEMFYPRSNSHIEKESTTLLFVSRLIERKGLQYVIPKLKMIEKETNKSIKMIIVGDGPYRFVLEELAENAKVRNDIIFVGQKGKDHLLKYYQQGDVFIFPSKKEGMPNAVLEAMASGLPIVMSPCQGSDELIDGNGIIADSDLDRFYESILKLLKLSDEQLQMMGMKSRERAVKLFSWSRAADEYLNVFHDIVL